MPERLDRRALAALIGELPFDKREYWVVTGGAMVLYGIRKDTGDLDLGCTHALAEELVRQGYPAERMADGHLRVGYSDRVELFEDWLEDRVETVDGIPVVSIEGLLAMKQALGREKDRRDVEAILAWRRERQ